MDSKETSLGRISICVNISVHYAYTHMDFFFFLLLLHVLCVHAMSQEMPLSTSITKIVFHYIEVLRFSFIHIHSSRCERQRTRWPCKWSASVQLFFFFSIPPTLRSGRVYPIPEEPRSDSRKLSKEETTWVLIPGEGSKRRSAYWKQGPIVIWVTQQGWRTGRSCEVIGGWRNGKGRMMWGTPCGGY